MLRPFNFHRPDAVTIGRYGYAPWCVRAPVGLATPFCRVTINFVVDDDHPKRQTTKYLRFLSSKTRFATELDSDDNSPVRTRSLPRCCKLALTRLQGRFDE